MAGFQQNLISRLLGHPRMLDLLFNQLMCLAIIIECEINEALISVATVSTVVSGCGLGLSDPLLAEEVGLVLET